MSDGLAHSAARGATVTLTAQGGRIVLQLLSIIVLSRLLSPHDYGLLTIVLVMIGIGEIFRDFGLTSASVQAPELSRGQRDNLFWINTGIGVALASLMYLAAWPLQAISGQPELLGIAQTLALMFVFNGLATQYRAQLMRSLRFVALAVSDIAAASLALIVAIAAAGLGLGYWALVLQQLTSGFVLLACLVLHGRWLPRWYSRTAPVRALVVFGWNLVATNLISYGASQIDTILVASRFGTASVGVYNRAYQLVMTPLSQMRSPLTNVALPVLSRIQHDRERFDAFVVGGQLALGYCFGIPLLLVAGLADPLVQILLGPQWTQAAPFLRCFAIAGLLSTLAFVGYWTYVARGLAHQLFRYTMVATVIKVVCVVTGSFFGLEWIAIGFMVAPALEWPLSLYWLSRITPFPARSLYGGAFRILAVAGTMGVVAWAGSMLVPHAGPWAQIGVGVGLAVIEAAALLVVRPLRRDLATLVGFARLVAKRRGEPAGGSEGTDAQDKRVATEGGNG